MSGKIERKSEKRFWQNKFNWMKFHHLVGQDKALIL